MGFFIKTALFFSFIASSLTAQAQSYPDKPIRIVTSFSAGSGPDALMRNVGDKVGKQVGQAIIMDNRPGANGWLAVDAVKKSPADGYTFLQVDNTHVSLQQHLFKKMPFDFNKDFEPAAPLYWTNFFIVVPANSKWNTVSDLVASAKEKSGALTFASWGVGSAGHVGAAMFEAETGTQMNHIPYKDLPSVYNAVANGEVDWAFGTAASAGPLFRAKKVKFLGIAAPKRLTGYLDIPTVSEGGGPKNFELKTWVAIYALKGTPKAAIDKFNQETLTALKDPDVQKNMGTFGFEPWLTTPAEVTKDAELQSKKFEIIVKQAKMSID
jgi:tripartite-type tricarboxylate transporter receptor subunit TctC